MSDINAQSRLVVNSIALILVAAILIAVLLPATQRASSHPIPKCKRNLKQIGLALAHYMSVWDAFPPAYTVDANGRPLHSWRSLILPYAGEEKLYKSIDFAKPWNDPANAKAYSAEPTFYRCSSADPGIPKNLTTYLAVVATDGCFLPSEARKFSDLTDGSSRTMTVIEVDLKNAVHWMAPSDADEALIMDIGPKSKLAHPGGTYVLLADCSVRFVSADLPASARRALISISGGDDPGDF